ncbi:MAG TPA: hypothetical protein DHD79_11125 [Firmicutes bacterium]|jgi:ABC-2 type transport system permease protein|nr:hypothetical protein [Bacillota bacterium]HBE05357.1 hypothetical protein [Bacillota bacterium]HBG44406.1 hypothetical protein [Bacillota bacterium]HBL51457.1 hypothetical protein [Bacillota bacterium]HBL68473.1 hypothetical protein [Bacillota bacterium]
MIRAYWKLAKTSFKRQMIYRAANLAGIATNLCWGFFRAYLLLAVLEASPGVGGYDHDSIIIYTGFSQALTAPLKVFGWWDLLRTIKSGEIISDFCKPIDFYGMWYARDCGHAVYQLAARGLPLMLLFLAIFRIPLRLSASMGLAFLISMTLALQVSFSWRMIYNAMAFWTLDAKGVAAMANIVSLFLMGFIIPVGFFPPWLQQAVQLTPFPAMFDIPLAILMDVPGTEVLLLLSRQVFWMLILIIAARCLLHIGTKKVVIQGG